MVGLSILPIGITQAVASVDTGLWYARSAEFLQSPLLERLRWLRIVGDTVFLMGVASLVYFAIGLATGWSYEPEPTRGAKELPLEEAVELA
jgi:nitric oxide reductase subunit B